jgi:hypothetical protein
VNSSCSPAAPGGDESPTFSPNEVICRLIFLIRLLKVDTVVCWDPWEELKDNEFKWAMPQPVL